MAGLVILVALVPVVACLLAFLRRRLVGGPCRCKGRLDGKTAIITGGGRGIGKQVAVELARRGARVVLGCRDVRQGLAAAREIKALVGRGAQASVRELDLADLQSVRSFAEAFLAEEDSLDLLINNAGVCKPGRTLSPQGYEMHFAVNHLGHFLLTLLLLPALRHASPSRVITVSSMAHKFHRLDLDDLNSSTKYTPGGAYGKSKLCNILFTRELAQRMVLQGVSAFALHPGVCRTSIMYNIGLILDKWPVLAWLAFIVRPFVTYFLKTPLEGAQTAIHLAVASSQNVHNGRFYDRCRLAEWSAQAEDDDLACRLWTKSAELCSLSGDEALEGQ